MSKTKKTPNYKLRLLLLQICSFICSIAPLAICLIVNWGKYTTTPDQTVKLTIGGILVVIFIAFKALDKIKISSGIIVSAAVFALTYLLESLLTDLMLLSGLALLGELLDVILFKHAIKVTKENIIVAKTADATTSQVEAVMQRFVGRV